MVNAIYCGLCISQSPDEARHGPKLSRGKEGALLFAIRKACGGGREGAMIDRVTGLLKSTFCRLGFVTHLCI